MTLDPLIVASAVGGALLGPSLHGWAVSAGEHLPLGGIAPRCRVCGQSRGWPGLRCRRCGAGGRRERVFPLVSAVVLAATSAVVGFVPVLPAFLAFAAVTLVLVVTDVDHRLIPNRILYPGGTAAAVLLAVGALLDGSGSALPRALGGGAGYFAVFFLVAVAARGGFGFGDVKLAALLGLFTAYVSPSTFLLSVFFTGFIGGVPALVLLVTRKARPTDELAYGPAMVLGSWTALACGEQFLLWYR